MAKGNIGGKRANSFTSLNNVTEHESLMNESFKMWGDNIRKQKGYVRTGLSFDINQALRNQATGADISQVDLGGTRDWGGNGRWNFNKVVKNMDELTSKKIPGNQNRLLTRFVGSQWAEKALGITDLNELMKIAPGTEFMEKGFMSTSTIASKNVFTGRPIKFEIEAPKNTRGFVADNLHESEIVLPRNSKFRISKVTKSSNGTFTIRMRVIDTPNNARGFVQGDVFD